MAEVSSKGFPRCAKCGGSESEHPVIHVEEGAYSACIDVEIAGLVQPSEAAASRLPPRSACPCCQRCVHRHGSCRCSSRLPAQ